MLLYSTGLRLSEALALELGHIDGQRQQIRVVKGKGAKDRYVGIPEVLLVYLRDYYRSYRPSHYLFNGKKAGSLWAGRSAQHALEQARSRAKITRTVSPHVLRHCYATHHLEHGTNRNVEPLMAMQQILQHLLPAYFHRSRSYGLHAPATRKRLGHQLQALVKSNQDTVRLLFRLLKHLLLRPLSACENCGDTSPPRVKLVAPDRGFLSTFLPGLKDRAPPSGSGQSNATRRFEIGMEQCSNC